LRPLCALAVFLIVSTGHAQSGGTIARCLEDAAKSHTACVVECDSERDTAKLNCRVPEGECGDLCKAAHASCIEPFNTDKDECIDVCTASLSSARAACGTQCGCTVNINCGTTTCFGDCMDAPTIAYASCKAACRRDSTYRSGIRACNRVLRLCGKTCNS